MPIPKVLPETANSKPSIIPLLPATKVPSHSQSRVKKPKITTTESVIQNMAAMTKDELDSAIQAALNKEDTFPQERPVQEEIGCLLDRIQGSGKADFACDQVLAWRAIAYGVTDKTTKTRKKYWEHWSGYCARFAIDPFLSNESKLQQIIILAGFAARVRTGTYGHGNQVKVQTVTEALAAISKTIELVGEQSPVYQAPNQYKLPLERLVEGFRREDPPAIPQLAVPVTVPNECQAFAEGQSDPGICATADLITIAFYYLLRVGEYTHPRRTKRGTQWIRTTRTKQFTVSDIGFFNDGNVLPRSSPLPFF